MPAPSDRGYYGFKVIGALKLISSLIAVAAALGTTHFLAHEPGPRLERVVAYLGLDPRSELIHAVISRLTGVTPKQLRAIAAGTYLYAILHSIEGIGLFLERAWAGYLVVIATSSLVPFEVYEIVKKPDLLRTALFLFNVGIVVYLIATLRREHLNRAKTRA